MSNLDNNTSDLFTVVIYVVVLAMLIILSFVAMLALDRKYDQEQLNREEEIKHTLKRKIGRDLVDDKHSGHYLKKSAPLYDQEGKSYGSETVSSIVNRVIDKA